MPGPTAGTSPAATTSADGRFLIDGTLQGLESIELRDFATFYADMSPASRTRRCEPAWTESHGTTATKKAAAPSGRPRPGGCSNSVPERPCHGTALTCCEG